MLADSSSGSCLQMVPSFLIILCHCLYLCYNIHVQIHCRSPKFRPSFGRLHELRTLVPPGTPMIALLLSHLRYVLTLSCNWI